MANPFTPTFGQILAGVTYVERPGVYAFLRNAQGEWAVVQTSFGWFLPGGGIEPGESHEAALTRELHEEIGYQLSQMNFFCQAMQYHWSEFYRQHFKKVGAFYEITAIATADHGHVDHSLLWIPTEEVTHVLSQEFQSWAFAQFSLDLSTSININIKE